MELDQKLQKVYKVRQFEKEVGMGTYRMLECSKCEEALHWGWDKPKKYNYCYNCGAKLDWSDVDEFKQKK